MKIKNQEPDISILKYVKEHPIVENSTRIAPFFDVIQRIYLHSSAEGLFLRSHPSIVLHGSAKGLFSVFPAE